MTVGSQKMIKNPSTILVRMPNWLGDLVMATPVLADLRAKWPDAKITVLCQGLGTILEHDPSIDEIISLKHTKGIVGRSVDKEQLKALKNAQYDLGVLLTNSFSSAWLFYRAGIKDRIGYGTHCRSLLLNHPIPFPPAKDSQHLVITYKMLLESLGIPLSDSLPALYLTAKENNEAVERLGVKGKIIGINPGAAYGSAKCWLPDRFKALTLRLIEKHPEVTIVFFGDKAGAPLVKEICQGLPSQVINLAGQTTVRELMALINQCDLFLTNDSGPMHIASALGIPLIALFGSTSDVTTGPYRGGSVIHKHVPCSPCYRRECPIDFRCMTQITVNEVFHQIEKEYLK